GGGHPGADGRIFLFQPRQQCARATQRQRNGERANQKAATQVVHSVAKQQRQTFAHGFLCASVVGQTRAYKEKGKTVLSRLSWKWRARSFVKLRERTLEKTT